MCSPTQRSGATPNASKAKKPLNSQSNSNQIYTSTLTSLRGILAVWVVAFHFRHALETLFPALQHIAPITAKGNLAVPAFFILSGYILGEAHGGDFSRISKQAVTKFYLLRLARIYPVHLITMLLSGSIAYTLLHFGYLESLSAFSAKDALYNILLIHMWHPVAQLSWNYPSWSISSEWFAYLLFPFFAMMTARLGHQARPGFILLASLGLALAGSEYYTRGHQQPFFGMVCIIPYFLSGLLFHQFQRYHDHRSIKLPRALLHCCTAAVLVAPFFLDGDAVSIVLLFVLTLMIFSLALSGTDSARGWQHPWLVSLGARSYSLYMTHALVQIALYRILPAAEFAEGAFYVRAGIFGIYLTLIWLACSFCFRYCEQPSRTRLKKHILNRL
nr:acyltransferase [Oceanococcus sp. HetDA_MAG_MS8]